MIVLFMTLALIFRPDDLDEVLPLAVLLADAVGNHEVVITGHEPGIAYWSPNPVIFFIHWAFRVNLRPGFCMVR